MVRTKHAFMVLGGLMLVLLGVVAHTAFRDELVAYSDHAHHAASVAETIDVPVPPSVEVVYDDTRARMRAHLKEKLQEYVTIADVPDGDATVSGITEEVIEPVTVPTTEVPPSLLCDPAAQMPTIPDWGAVTVVRAEGARLITSSLHDEAGVPLHTLQLPETPVVTGITGCLGAEMVAIGLDGTTRVPNEAVPVGTEGLWGYAVDGFPILGSIEDGAPVDVGSLDICRGHVHAIEHDGIATSLYHYHITDEAPYTLGCFRGTP